MRVNLGVNLQGYPYRDTGLMVKGATVTVKVAPSLLALGGRGGMFAKWATDGVTGEPMVELADGRYCGYMPFGSNEPRDQYTAITGQNTRYGYVVVMFGENLYYCKCYETQTYKARHGIVPLTPIVYQPNQTLYVSENGLLTNEDESDIAVNPGHTFPDGSPIIERFNNWGYVMLTPCSGLNNYLGVTTS